MSYPAALDHGLTISHRTLSPGAGVVVLPPEQAIQRNNTLTPEHPTRRLPSRRSKISGEDNRRHSLGKRKRGRTSQPESLQGAPVPEVLRGKQAEDSLLRSSLVISRESAEELMAMQRLVDYMGEDHVRQYLGL